jgi:hypothetical protein
MVLQFRSKTPSIYEATRELRFFYQLRLKNLKGEKGVIHTYSKLSQYCEEDFFFNLWFSKL